MKYRIEVIREKDGVIKTNTTTAIKNKTVASSIYQMARAYVGKMLPDGKVVDVNLIIENN